MEISALCETKEIKKMFIEKYKLLAEAIGNHYSSNKAKHSDAQQFCGKLK